MFFSTAMRPTFSQTGRARPSGCAPARSGRGRIAEAARLQFLLQRRCRHHQGGRLGVEAAQERIAPGERNAGSRVQIFGEARMKRCREGNLLAHAEAARGKAERAFGRDVDRVRIRLADHPGDPGARKKRQPDFLVGRQRHRAKHVGRDEGHVMAHRAQVLRQLLERAHHAVDLRRGGIGHDDHTQGLRKAADIMGQRFSPQTVEQSGGAALLWRCGEQCRYLFCVGHHAAVGMIRASSSSPALAVSPLASSVSQEKVCHVMRERAPVSSSQSAEQLSTQSPSLQ